MQPTHHAYPDYKPRKRRISKRRLWNLFVMGVGYAALAYSLVRGIIYLLVLAQDWIGT